MGCNFDSVARSGSSVGAAPTFCKISRLTSVSDNTHKVLKVCIHEFQRKSREQIAYDAMRDLPPDSTGAEFVRHILDDFDVCGPSGYWHHCFVFRAAACTISDLIRVKGPLPVDAAIPILRNVIRGVDFLHNVVHLVHTDVKASNVVVPFRSAEPLEMFVRSLGKDSCKPKKSPDGQRRTYLTRTMPIDSQRGWGAPVLGDLGEARLLPLDKNFTAEDMVGAYANRAPETVLWLDWGHEVDIWAVGCLVANLLTGRDLFDGPPAQGDWSDSWHVAQMVAQLGPPPTSILSRSKISKQYFDNEGGWRYRDGYALPDISLEQKLGRVDEELRGVITDFLRGILTWDADEREKPRQLLQHPFLRRNRDEEGTTV